MKDKSLEKINEIYKEKNDGIIFKPNCKLCNSKNRSEAEDLYIETDNISSVFRFLKSKGENISMVAVRSHIQNHFNNKIQEERMQYYLEDLNKWRDIQARKEEKLKLYLTMLEKRIFQIASNLDGKNDSEGIRNTDTLARIILQASSLQDKLDEEHNKMEPAKIVIKKLQEIIEIKVKSNRNPEFKNELIELVSDLQGNIGGLLGDG